MILRYLLDYFHAGTAFLLLVPLFLFPGYILGESTDIFHFRSQNFLTRTCLSLGFSIAIAPIILFFLWSASVQWAIAGYYLSALAGTGLMLKNRWRIRQIRIPPILALIGIAWFLLALFSLVDLPVGSGLYVNAVAKPDYSYRAEVVAQLARTSRLPPLSPFFASHSNPTILRYHYFWLMLCGIIPKITGWRIGSRDALNGSVPWIGYLLLAMVALYWKFAFKAKDVLRMSIASVPVMLLGGLQGLAFFVLALLHRLLEGWWQLPRPTLTWIETLGQITYWLDSLLWVPHCVAATLASLGALLALYEMHHIAHWRQRAVLIVVAGLSLASTVGLSVFVGIPFIAYLGVLCAYRLFKAPERRLWVELASTLLLAVSLIAPYLLSIRAPAGTPFPVTLSIRPSSFANFFVHHIHGITPAVTQLIYLAAEPLVVIYELGIMALIAIWAFKQRKAAGSKEERVRENLIALFALITILIVMFANSAEASGGSNDLGWRATLGVLFFLVFYGVRFFDCWRKNGLPSLFPSWGHKLRPVLVLLIVIGFGTTLTEFLVLRLYYVINNTREVGVHTADLRTALDFLRHNSASESVVQLNPEMDNVTYSGLFMERGTALRQADADSHFTSAVSAGTRSQEEIEITPIFDDTRLPFGQVQQKCSAVGIDYLVFQPGDAVFMDKESWVWQLVPFYANQSVRIYRC